jgi:hypothetical protein
VPTIEFRAVAAFSHRREYARRVAETGTASTRTTRVSRAAAMIAEGARRS